MRFEDAMAEAYQGKSSPIDPGVLDPHFDICIKARSAMTQPCHCRTGGFFGCYYDQLDQYHQTACWVGHIIKAYTGRASINMPNDEDRHTLLTVIAKKLGFESFEHIYYYNDSRSHPEVIREFDRRLQLWT